MGGSRYVYVDRHVVPHVVYYYKLEEVGVSERTFYRPFVASLTPSVPLYLPLVMREP